MIGSNLVETLLNRGETVIGVDEFNDYYDPELKRKNIARFEKYPGFELVEGDILSLNWRSLLSDTKVIFHQAAQAGVRASWGDGFR
ncbi:NAD-dependent epimerase/dehydratase family protein, partial [Microcoleus sp. HI-ES]|nr:NAD-dependent epimerase/dehydratase family protein [Microcoleus sp. HI-ES]